MLQRALRGQGHFDRSMACSRGSCLGAGGSLWGSPHKRRLPQGTRPFKEGGSGTSSSTSTRRTGERGLVSIPMYYVLWLAGTERRDSIVQWTGGFRPKKPKGGGREHHVWLCGGVLRDYAGPWRFSRCGEYRCFREVPKTVEFGLMEESLGPARRRLHGVSHVRLRLGTARMIQQLFTSALPESSFQPMFPCEKHSIAGVQVCPVLTAMLLWKGPAQAFW